MTLRWRCERFWGPLTLGVMGIGGVGAGSLACVDSGATEGHVVG